MPQIPTFKRQDNGHVISQVIQPKKTSIKSVHNFSSYIVNATEQRILELGLNYAIPIKSNTQLMIDSALNIESCIQSLNQDICSQQLKNELRVDSIKILKSEINRTKKEDSLYS